MARKIKMPADSPAFWTLEAEPSELQEYVTSRVQPRPTTMWTHEGFPIEPAWFAELFDASWTWVLAEAITW